MSKQRFVANLSTAIAFVINGCVFMAAGFFVAGNVVAAVFAWLVGVFLLGCIIGLHVSSRAASK